MKAVLRQVHGVVWTKRRLLAGYHRLRPLRPPVESAELVRRMLVRQKDESFFTGNGLAAQCRYVVNYDVFLTNDEVDNNWWFTNPEFLEYFFRKLEPDEEYVLFTQNSNVDRPIDRHFERKLNDPKLLAWFSPHVDFRHPKLFAIPLGIGNPLKCDAEALKAARESCPGKSQLFEASYSLRTNPEARTYCMEQTGIEPLPKAPTPQFFERLAAAYFCISPRGNGIDCYRTWQALHLRTIPIVTRSILNEQQPEIPMIVLDDWAEFRSVDFSSALYEETWGDWDLVEISLPRYIDRIRSTVSRLRDGR